MCGFWQAADGSPPVRCWQSLHTCEHQLPPETREMTCEHCLQTFRAAQPGEMIEHLCGKYLLPDDPGYECRTCGKHLGQNSATPFPLAGSG